MHRDSMRHYRQLYDDIHDRRQCICRRRRLLLAEKSNKNHKNIDEKQIDLTAVSALVRFVYDALLEQIIQIAVNLMTLSARGISSRILPKLYDN